MKLMSQPKPRRPDLDALANRSYVTASDNVARITSDRPGAVHVRWERSPSPRDAAEFFLWAQDVAGGELSARPSP